MSHDSDHRWLLPRSDEHESDQRLDALLERLVASNLEPDMSAAAVAEHLASLAANLQRPARTGRRAVLDRSVAGAVRWLEVSLGAEIDTMLLGFLASDGCAECRLRWATHLLQSRGMIYLWAARRELEANLGS